MQNHSADLQTARALAEAMRTDAAAPDALRWESSGIALGWWSIKPKIEHSQVESPLFSQHPTVFVAGDSMAVCNFHPASTGHCDDNYLVSTKIMSTKWMHPSKTWCTRKSACSSVLWKHMKGLRLHWYIVASMHREGSSRLLATQLRKTCQLWNYCELCTDPSWVF